MTSFSNKLLFAILLECVTFGFSFSFLSSPLFSELPAPSLRPSGSRLLNAHCRLQPWPSSFPNKLSPDPARRQLTRRAFQANEVIAKPPEVDVTFRPRATRVIALGDVHGDLFALDTALMFSDLMDAEGRWTGGKAILVQMGDILDRGPDESECLQRLLSLQAQARAVGGDVIMLLGNHEIMNADLDFRYVEPLGWVGWEYDESREEELLARLQRRQRAGAPGFCDYMLPRIQALERGRGMLANTLAKMPVAVTIGETVFIHGGLVPEVVSYGLKRMNEETAEWLRGQRPSKPWVLDNCKVRGVGVEDELSPLWHRAVGRDDVCDDALAEVDAAMRLLGARRLVVGHTPQVRGVNCVETQEGREVWRVDTGMSEGILSGHVETLEICMGGDGEEKVNVVHAEGVAAAQARVSRKGAGPSWKQELVMPEPREARMPVLTMP